MNKLRHSLILRTLAAFLMLITAAVTIANCVIFVQAAEQNLIYADRTAVERKVYSFFAEESANEIKRYFEIARKSTSNNEYFNYYYNESELFRSKFSEAYSNIAFEVKDSEGNVVLNNFSMPDYAYEYHIKFYLEENDSLLTVEAATDVTETKFSENETVIQENLTAFTEENIPDSDAEFTIFIYVPHEILLESDSFYLAQRLIDAGIEYRYIIIPFTVICVILFLCCFIFILWGAGYTKKSEKAIAGGLHKIPFDLTALLLLGASCFAGHSIDSFSAFMISAGVSVFILAETLAVRLRAHTALKSNLLFYLFSGIKKLVSVIDKHLDILWKAGIVFLASTILDFVLFTMINNSRIEEFFLVILLLKKLAEALLLIFVCINMNTLQNGAKTIANGGNSKKIESPLLFGEFKENAAYLNSINIGVNRAVQERIKSESTKTELITNVSHDLKTPLTSIVNYIDLLKKTDVQNPDAINYIEIIDRQAQRLKKLTVDIVEASKAATGNIEVRLERTVLNVMLNQVAGEYMERLEKSRLQLIDSIPEEEIAVMADGRLLSRVIDNLMTNICKYSMPNTRVYLSLLNCPDNTAKLVFKNISGDKLNISPNELTERFVRGDASRNTEGSGLGLSIAKSLTEAMHGKLEISIDGDLFKVEISFTVIG